MMMPTELPAVLAGMVLGFAAWCVRVELRLNRERQALVSLEHSLRELRLEVKSSSDDLHRHGETLAAIKATVDLTASSLRDLGFRLERMAERTL